MFDPLPDDLRRALAPDDLDQIRFAHEVDSTNDLAMSLAAAGAPDGTAVVADVQRAGRGRRGRSWFSPPGAGLYLSIVAREVVSPAALSLVTLAAGVAAAGAVTAESGLPLELKWPNDLVVGRPWRKLGGLLCESVGVGGRVDAVVIGIGVNLRIAAYPPEIADRATSIEAELGRTVDRGLLVAACLARVREGLTMLRGGQGRSVCDAWRRLGAAGLDRSPVRWQDQDGPRAGIAKDIDDRGALVVDVDGRLDTVVAGEVVWERLSRG